jgi:hypothetical protein
VIREIPGKDFFAVFREQGAWLGNAELIRRFPLIFNAGFSKMNPSCGTGFFPSSAGQAFPVILNETGLPSSIVPAAKQTA